MAQIPRCSIFLTLLMLLMPLTPMLLVQPVSAGPAEASTAVPLEVLKLGSGNIDDPSVVGDSQGNFHVIWVENQTKLMYAQIDADGSVSNGPAVQSFGGSNVKHSTTMAIDAYDNLHYAFLLETNSDICLRYIAVEPRTDSPNDSWFGPTSNSYGTVVCKNRIGASISNPDIAVDSQGAAHIVWQDKDDPLDNRYGLFGIRYAMMEANWSTQTPDSPIFDTLLTPGASQATHPEVAMTARDEVAVTWQDTRGSMVELVILMDMSGSMNSELSDLCIEMYGGSSGGYSTPGLKAITTGAGVIVLETIYGLGDYSPNCAGHTTNQNSRSVMLTPLDHSGGTRKLHRTVFNGQSQNWGYQAEDWGPGSTWACLSWKDANGNIGNQSNPPTQFDHKWNPHATKFLLPMADEGPKGGDPAQQSDDVQSINEAHETCANGGVVPVPFLGYTTGSTSVGSHMRDLAECPNGVVNINQRTCSGTNDLSTDAGGQYYTWPSSGSGVLLDTLMGIANSGATEVWTTVLDPYSKLQDPGHQRGSPAHTESGGDYVEDVGWGSNIGNHFVVVNDTRITTDEGWSTRPSMEIASNGWFEYIWTDSRNIPGRSPSDSQEVYWRRVNLGSWDFSGQPNGIDIHSISGAVSGDQTLSPLDGVGSVGSRDIDAHSAQPAFAMDADDLMHITWVEHDSGEGVNISYRRSTDATRGPLQGLPNPWWVGCPSGDQASTCPGPTYEVSDWDSEKMDAGNQNVLVDVDEDDGSSPSLAVTSDRRRTAAVAWVDSEPCGGGSAVTGEHLCLRRIQRSLLQIEPDAPSLLRSLEPGESVMIPFTLHHLGSFDQLVATTVHLDWTSTMSDDWTISAVAGSGQGSMALNPLEANFDLASGTSLQLNLTIEAPSSIEAGDSEHHLPTLTIVSNDNLHSDAVDLDINLQVVHDISLSAPLEQIDIEQGGSGVFSVEISNNGNLWEEISFPGRESEEGRALWNLPFGWDVQFADSVLLDIGQNSSKNLVVEVPDFQEPGEVTLTVVASSAKSSDPGHISGAQALLNLTIDVIRKRAGNIVFELWDTFEQALPGECASFNLQLTKNFGGGDIRLELVDGPIAKPGSIEQETWSQDHWTVVVDFSMLPGGNSVPFETARYFTNGMSRSIEVKLCAPFDALAGDREQVTLRAVLVDDTEVYDEVTMEVEVMPLAGLEASWDASPSNIEPGQTFEVSVTVENIGNVPQTFEARPGSTIPNWVIDAATDAPNGLGVGDHTQMVLLVAVPLDALAGETSVIIEFHTITSDESYRTQIEGIVEVLPRVDLQLHLADGQSGELDLRPGEVADIAFIAVNAGNWAEAPWLDNHTTGIGGSLSAEPRMDGLTGVQTKWFVVENAGTPLALYTEIDPDARGRLRLPMLGPGESVPVVFRMNLFSHPGWDHDEIGVRLRSSTGFETSGGDIDADTKWLTEDNNEQVIRFNIYSPDLYVMEVNEELDGGEVVLQIKIQNSGNDPAVNILVRVCDMSIERAEAAGCDRNDAVSEQRIPYVDAATDGVATTHVITIRLVDSIPTVVVAVDAENEVIESDETNNMMERELILVGGEATGGTIQELTQFAADNFLIAFMLTLWAAIIIIGFTAWRGRNLDRRVTSSGVWRDDGGWGDEIAKNAKPKKRGMFKSKETASPEDEMQIATVHSMDAPPTGSSVDMSDLDLTSAESPPPSEPVEALKTLGEDSYDPTEKKAEKGESTIGDLIDDLW